MDVETPKGTIKEAQLTALDYNHITHGDCVDQNCFPMLYLENEAKIIFVHLVDLAVWNASILH